MEPDLVNNTFYAQSRVPTYVDYVLSTLAARAVECNAKWCVFIKIRAV